MAKKIRFPLKLAEGKEVRTLEELREHFDLEAILEYYKNGKLLTWLGDRYLEGEAEAIRTLDETGPDFQQQLCAVFQVEYTGDDVDLDDIERRQERLKRMREITDDAEFIQNIDRVAFDQEELADLLDEGEAKIYLCGERFTVPASRKGITYVGIKNPSVHISGNVPEKLEELGIEFVGVDCDNLPKAPAPAPQTATTEATVCNGELPEKILKMMMANVISLFYVLDHYFLYKQGSDENAKWVRYEIATGEETVLSDEIAHPLSEKTMSENSHENLIASGDEIAYRTENSCSILNLHTLVVENNNVDLRGFGSFVFSEDYIVTVAGVGFFESAINIYSRHTHCLLHKIASDRDLRISLDGKLIATNRRLDTSSCQLSGNKMYFVIWKDIISGIRQVASFDLDTSKYTSYQVNIRGDIIKIANNYAYLVDVDTVEGSFTISAFNLQDTTEQKVIQSKKWKSPEHIVVKMTNQYIIGWERKGNESVNLFAIDLFTFKVKRLPCSIESSGFDRFKKNRCILLDSKFYCFRYVSYVVYGREHISGVDCKFDLTEEYPQPVELKL